MKRDEAREELIKFIGTYECPSVEAMNIAIEALKQTSDAIQLLDDGTLKVKVNNVLDIKRIMIMDNNIIHTIQINQKTSG